MKKFLLVLVVSLLVSGCAGESRPNTLKVGATQVPHAEILEFVKPLLKEEGIDLEIIVYDDYIQPNLNLRDDELDANFFQHYPYLERFNVDYNLELVALADVHIEPMGIYSDKYKTLDSLVPGSKVLIPGDPTNGGRALALLEKAGLLELRKGVGVMATPADVIDNPHNLELVELDAAFIVNALPDAGLAVINTNFAIQVGLVPTQDALFLEGGQSPYVNILVVKKKDRENKDLLKLAEILTSPAVAQYIADNYRGEVLPVN